MLDSLESGSVAFGAAALAALQNELANGGHSFTIPVSVVDGYQSYSGQLLASPMRITM